MVKVKILTITVDYYPQLGGIATVVKEISERLVKHRHDCTVLTINPGNSMQNEKLNGVNIIRMHKSSNYLYGLNPSLWFHLHNSNLKDEYDIIHLHGYHSLISIECACLIKRKVIPFVFSPYYHGIGHKGLPRYLFTFYNPLGEKIFKWAKTTICISTFEESLIKRDFNISADRLRVIPIGVRCLDFMGKSKDNREGLSLLYVGALSKYKGVEYVLKAVNKLNEECKFDVILDVVGKGEEEKHLKDLATSLKISDNILWSGSVSDATLYQKYKEADILLLLSKAESYGLAVAEALALGTPCIVSNTTALKEFLDEPGCFGISYPPNVNELTKLILTVYNSNPKVGPFSNKIRTWDRVVEDYEDVYLTLLND